MLAYNRSAMQQPAIRYVKTADGFDIAYTVTGAGRPFIFMPWPLNNVSLIWSSQFGRPLLDALAELFMLVQYDSRGQGMSSRGLPEYHSMADYVADLEAVVDALELDRFVLYGAPLFSHVAVRYATEHVGRVEALILGDTAIDIAWGAYEEIARRDWEFYLYTIASAFSLQGAPLELPYWRESLNQDDCLKMLRAGKTSSIRKFLHLVRAPTLILNTRRLAPDTPEHLLADEGRKMAALMPQARLVLFDGFASSLYSSLPEPPAAVAVIEDFLAGLALTEADPNSKAGDSAAPTVSLSPREIEVLRLVVKGKTNREIAEELVISERTVINHLSHVFIKTGAENRAGATAYAFRHHLA